MVSTNYVYIGSGNFKLIGWKSTDYVRGQLYNQSDSTGAREEFRYTGGRLTSHSRADGTSTTYTLDALYRVSRAQSTGVVSTGGFAAQDNVNTDYTYNAADRILTTTTAPAGGGLSLATSATYNLAGQVTSTTDPASLSTTYAYANGGRTVTVTHPGGATTITDRWLDGSAKSVTGTAQPAAYQAVTVNTSNGNLTTNRYALRTADISTPTSAPRWSRVTSDWLGRPVTEERPAPPGASPSTFTVTSTYNSVGQLTKRSETGIADTLYQYDGQGELQYSGLDVNANGSLDLGGMDRVTQVRSQVYNDTSQGAWYLQRQAYVYNQDNNGTPLLQSDTRTRLVPYLGNNTDLSAGKVLTEQRSYDVFGNLTIQTAAVDRASRLATVTTNLPDSSVDAVVTALNGRQVRSVTAQNLTYDTYYDALGRVIKTTDPRTDTSSTARIGYYTSGTGQTGRVAWREDSAGNRTNYAYESTTGRLSTETDPLGKVARYAYTTRGQVYRTWGDTTYPVEHAFNDYGEQVTLSTFRGGSGWNASTWPSSPGTADLTTWAFDPASGTLTSKTDAVSQVTTYTYTTRGQLKTRQWARGVTATYAYSATTAELTSVDYSDSTTDLTYTYNRLGQTATVTDVTGTRAFNYSSATSQLTREDLGSFVGTRSLSYTYDTTGTGTKGRLTQLGAGLTSNPGAEYALGYGYDTYGRLNQASTFTYAYTSGSNLLASIYDAASAWTQTRTYESNRNLLDVIETKYSTASKARFDYTNDTLGRRTGVAKTGQMYARYSSAGLDTAWGYNDRSELTSESSKLGGTSTTLAGRDDAYDFDHIGNRKSVTRNGSTSTYTANALNQYTQTTDPGVIDVTGLAPAAATVTVNGSSTGVTRQNDWYYKPFSVTNTSTAVWSSLTIASSYGGSESRSAFVPLTPEAFSHDVDGNLTSDGRWTYTYDAENRLVAMQTQTALSPSPFPNADARRIEFKNDYLGRRVQKTVRGGYNGTTFTTVVSDEKFVYAGWNLVLKLNAASSNALMASYYWGLDWSGTMGGAGGVGGLLKVQEGGNTYVPMYDGNGNVMGLVRWTPSVGQRIG